jgi:hypothetical protein
MTNEIYDNEPHIYQPAQTFGEIKMLFKKHRLSNALTYPC